MDAIAQIFHVIAQFRYTFIGLVIGWGSGHLFRLATSTTSDDAIVYAAGICAITGLVLDIKRRSGE